MKGALVRPIARYPSAVAYDDPLKVASNRVSTTLARNAGLGDTLLTVSDASRIVPQMLFTIDSEILSVSAVDYSTSMVTVIRGFDGTQPACHSAGTTLNANITAWHHNVLAAEITAIEQALGPNLSNVGGGSGGGSIPGMITNCAYMFAAQSPGGSLNAGLNVITLAPVPQGIYGTSLGHPLYISGGTGAAEAVTIGGGTAVAGASSGTVIVTCVNAHSGAWTIGSASGGIQEAIAALPVAGGEVIVSCDSTLRADVVSLGKQVLVRKLAAQKIINLGNPYSVLGSISYDPNAECVYTTEAIILGSHSSDDARHYPFDTGVAIVRGVSDNPAYTQGYSTSSMFIQQDYNGAAGTPFGIRAQLNCSKDVSSFGVAGVASYTEMGAASGTIGMGLHGDSSSYSPNSTCISVNAEGNYWGSTPGGTLYGYVCLIGTENTSATTMRGVHVSMQPNPGGVQNAGGGVDIFAQISGSHKYGLYIGENGGAFEQTAVLSSQQVNASNLVLNNNTTAAPVGTTNILFRRTSDPLSAPTTNVTASITASHASSNADAGTLKLATGNGTGAVVTGLTVHPTQQVTVANCIETTPIPVSQLPPAGTSIGCWACVNDATSNTVGSPITGGAGSFTVGLFCSTRGWIVVAN